jgi:hypothetical protein
MAEQAEDTAPASVAWITPSRQPFTWGFGAAEQVGEDGEPTGDIYCALTVSHPCGAVALFPTPEELEALCLAGIGVAREIRARRDAGKLEVATSMEQARDTAEAIAGFSGPNGQGPS